MNIQRIKRGRRVQHRVIGRQDRAENGSSHKAEQPLRGNRRKNDRERRIAVAPIHARVSKRTDNTRNDQRQRREQVDQTGKDHALLSMRQTLRAQSALDNRLIAAPEVNIVYDQTGKQHGPRPPRLVGSRFAPRIDHRRIGMQELIQAVEQTAAAACLRGQENQS